jgi:hypothetical protein
MTYIKQLDFVFVEKRFLNLKKYFENLNENSVKFQH